MSLVYANDPTITYSCPPGALQATWSLRTDGQGGYIMDTRGNGCFMQYSFTGSSISIQIVNNFDHGWYSCTLDDHTPQWFNANTNAPGYGAACALAGASNDKHTIKVTNSDEPGWALSINNITLSSASTAQNVTTFTSVYTPVQVPVALTASASGSACTSTVTATGTSLSNATAGESSKNTVSTGALGAVAGVLGVLLLIALGAAVVFWRRDRHSRQQLQWAMDMSNAATPFTTNASTSLSLQARGQQPIVTPYDPWEANSGVAPSVQPPPSSIAGDTAGSSSGGVEPSPAYTPSAAGYPAQKRG
ncbi:hypothetical protein FRB95_004580 [Tulasnella sp. JGI-2019a]|nr:hypothetical protein FRB95_004580 [Tulasnella sp. JGI-2019a]